MNNLLVQDVANFADILYSVTESCNNYFNNQITDNFDIAIAKTNQLIEQFITSEDENIKDIINSLNSIITEIKTANIADTFSLNELSILDKIRNITDIIEHKNLVLTFKH